MMNMTSLKNVFKKVKLPRPQMSARTVYSTTPSQRRDYLAGIHKARGKAKEYNKYIGRKRSEYIRNQEEYKRKLANLRKATKSYDTNRRDLTSEISRVKAYEQKLKKQHQKVLAEKRRKAQRSHRGSSSRRRYASSTAYKTRRGSSPIKRAVAKKTKAKISKPKKYSSPIKRILHNPLDRFM